VTTKRYKKYGLQLKFNKLLNIILRHYIYNNRVLFIDLRVFPLAFYIVLSVSGGQLIDLLWIPILSGKRINKLTDNTLKFS